MKGIKNCPYCGEKPTVNYICGIFIIGCNRYFCNNIGTCAYGRTKPATINVWNKYYKATKKKRTDKT